MRKCFLMLITALLTLGLFIAPVLADDYPGKTKKSPTIDADSYDTSFEYPASGEASGKILTINFCASNLTSNIDSCAIKIYIDEETTPSINMPISDLRAFSSRPYPSAALTFEGKMGTPYSGVVYFDKQSDGDTIVLTGYIIPDSYFTRKFKVEFDNNGNATFFRGYVLYK